MEKVVELFWFGDITLLQQFDVFDIMLLSLETANKTLVWLMPLVFSQEILLALLVFSPSSRQRACSHFCK